VSFSRLDLKKDYLKSLEKEINHYYDGENLNTLYLGGGTPSVLSITEAGNILGKFNFANNSEITMELNPDDVCYDYMRGLFDLGINRVSFGCQTFDDEILKQINRRHTSIQVVEAVKTSQKAGFRNISLDFIYGLPGQRLEGFLEDLNKAIDLGIAHISLYGLKLEDGCYFYKNLPKNLPDDDMQADMYIEAVELLTKAGFEHYEVSNFSKPGFNSRHNLTYWNNEEYYGFGIAAHGYKNGVRYGNFETFEEYLANSCSHKESKLLSAREKLEEEIFLGFRRMGGIDTNQINLKYGIDFCEKYKDILAKYEKLKLIEKTKEGYKFTLSGILVSNVVLADFI